MFEELFNYPTVLTRHLKAPLLRERRSYLAYRARDGTSRETLLRIARELLVIVDEMDLDSQISESWLTSQVKYRLRPSDERKGEWLSTGLLTGVPRTVD